MARHTRLDLVPHACRARTASLASIRRSRAKRQQKRAVDPDSRTDLSSGYLKDLDARGDSRKVNERSAPRWAMAHRKASYVLRHCGTLGHFRGRAEGLNVKNAPQAGLTYRENSLAEAESSPKELEILEQVGRATRSERDTHGLVLSPINGAWILEGNPLARGKLLSTSTDGMASTFLWDCTAGRFNWYYELDETVYLLEGSVVIKDSMGERHQLRAGDSFLFKAGTQFEWTIEDYVRKVAFCRVPMSRKILAAKRLYQALRRFI